MISYIGHNTKKKFIGVTKSSKVRVKQRYQEAQNRKDVLEQSKREFDLFKERMNDDVEMRQNN